jgi:hypothetical protein
MCKQIFSPLLWLALASACFAGTSYPPLPYTDSFNGSGPSNPTPDIHVDDNGVSFWTTIPSSLTTPEQATEAGGKATLASATEFGATVVGADVSSTFNFFNGPLTFELSGLLMTGSASTPNQLFRFAVQDSGSVLASAAESYALIDITGDNHLTFNIKESQVGLFQTLQNVTLSGTATGISLTLDGSALTYSLIVSEGATSQIFSGALPNSLVVSAWGDNLNKGSSALSFAVFDNQAPVVQGVPDSLVSASIDEVTVVPEPSTWWAGCGAAGVLLVWRRLKIHA